MSVARCKNVSSELLLKIKEELANQIAHPHLDSVDKAWLWHEVGSIEGMLNNRPAQFIAWIKALHFDPKNKMIRKSLNSLTKQTRSDVS